MAFKDAWSLGLLTRQKTSVACQMVHLTVKVKEGLILLLTHNYDNIVVICILTYMLST